MPIDRFDLTFPENQVISAGFLEDLIFNEFDPNFGPVPLDGNLDYALDNELDIEFKGPEASGAGAPGPISGAELLPGLEFGFAPNAINPTFAFPDLIFDPSINGGAPTEGFSFEFFGPPLGFPQGGINRAPYQTSSILFISTDTPLPLPGQNSNLTAANADTPPQTWAGTLGTGQTTHGIGQVPTGPAVIVNVPEPSTVLSLLAIGGLTFGLKRKQTI